jgi:GH43 family beta-xylosidase
MKINDIHIRDPYIIKANGNYYLLGTTGNDCWEAGSDLNLYKSNNLFDFENIGAMVDKSIFCDYTNIWAPEMHYFNKKYYLILSVYQKGKGRGSIILYSESIEKKYQLLTGDYITPTNWDCLDATLFIQNKKPYLVFSNEWINTVKKDGDGALYVSELSKDLKEFITEPKKIISGKDCGFATEITNNGISGYVAEGPFLIEEKGKINLFWSTFTPKGYCVVKSVADSVFGEYKFDKFVFEDDGGHCMVFEDFNGKQRIIFHKPNNSPYERMSIFEL